MDQRFLQNASIGLLAVALMASGYALKKIMQPSALRIESQEFSYEMPRAKSDVPAYSLAGRKVIRTLHSAQAQSHAPAQLNGPVVVNSKPVDPKAAAAQNGKKADAKKTTKTAQKKKPQMTVSLISQSNIRMSGFDKTRSASEPADVPMTGFSAPDTTARQAVAVQEDDEDQAKLSPAQWRALLHNQPTSKNGARFLAAYQAREVDENSFYHITEELFLDSATDRQKLGFDLLKATPSAKSFTVLLTHYQDKSVEALRAQIAAVLNTYSQASHFQILGKLLLSNNAQVVQAAQSILARVIATQGQPNNGQPINGRDARSPGSAAISVSQYNAFIPALERLIKSNDATVAQQAQQLLERIRALQLASA